MSHEPLPNEQNSFLAPELVIADELRNDLNIVIADAITSRGEFRAAQQASFEGDNRIIGKDRGGEIARAVNTKVEEAERKAIENWVITEPNLILRAYKLSAAANDLVARVRDSRTLRFTDYQGSYRSPSRWNADVDPRKTADQHDRATVNAPRAAFFRAFLEPYTKDVPAETCFVASTAIADFCSAEVRREGTSKVAIEKLAEIFIDNPHPVSDISLGMMASRKVLYALNMVQLVGRGDERTDRLILEAIQLSGDSKNRQLQKLNDTICRVVTTAIALCAPNTYRKMAERMKGTAKGTHTDTVFMPQHIAVIAGAVRTEFLSQDTALSPQARNQLEGVNLQQINALGTAFELIVYGMGIGMFGADPDSAERLSDNGALIQTDVELVHELAARTLDARSKMQRITIGDFVTRAFERRRSPEAITNELNKRLNE